SRTPEVDVGQICSSLGGGGHPYAASATVKEKTLAQVKDELFGLLYSHINPQILVTSLMSRPAVTVQEDTTIAKASEIMTRYGLKAVPVVDSASGGCTGILEHQLADKAVSHGLGDVQVGEYMMRDITSVPPETDLYPVMEIILGQRQRLVPVISDEKIVGVITRTDLINSLVKEPARIPDSLLPERKRERQITALMRERLPKEIFALLQEAGHLAEKRGITVYAVGGFVRDILLYRPNLDLDLVVEDDGIEFARELSRKLGGRVRAHKKFRTAVVILPDGQRIDVATARLEYYEHPAALPTVELSSIKMDLFRRDFTINALALELNPDSFGRLVDFFGGQKDIKDRNIRVLHSLSFVEDPTRILRAIRFEQRFTFRIGGQTERLIKNAVKLNMFHKLSGSRVFQELKLILEEKNPLACLVRMEKFGVLQSIHPLLKLDPTKERILQEMDKVISWYRLLYLEQPLEAWMVYFLGLCAGFDPAQVRILARRLAFTKKLERSFISLRGDIDKAVEKLHRWQYANGPMSELYFIMEKLPLEGVLYLMGRSQKESLRKSISQYLTQLRGQQLDISGDDLKRLGFEPGPEFSRILDEILAAKIDGLASDRQSQLELAKGIRQQQDSQGDSLVIDG
ncbi:MAG: CBS domain-containing protein, partial [Desulfohalobiaceae bacterium]